MWQRRKRNNINEKIIIIIFNHWEQVSDVVCKERQQFMNMLEYVHMQTHFIIKLIK